QATSPMASPDAGYAPPMPQEITRPGRADTSARVSANAAFTGPTPVSTTAIERAPMREGMPSPSRAVATQMRMCGTAQQVYPADSRWEADDRAAYDTAMFAFAARLVRPYMKWLVIVGAAMAVETTTTLAAPWPLKIVLDSVFDGRPLPD